ncbi:zinc dependent phospholipase C family protein [Azospirillum sp. YIM DDC1]|uniref:Zinc dependent phospholipase C family protein n=1 Tax=Azospirillum aestuarii TaxID=2802052 RepID=A0ABS1I707_9PROT|nr:zinc dependent phospholipase C family protein [Azospirillum aestuarii]MBK4722726.1 zinc dependent phospholipase C family protein [Azospirillum aestuarii]
MIEGVMHKSLKRQFERVIIVAACAFFILQHEQALAWGLKTHAWIAQEVIKDVEGDGAVTLGGQSYPVPQEVAAALRSHPERYRMGSLGPDVFPDPIVGQTTTHPGIAGGWQTDDWLKQILWAAKNTEEIAFAYGFAAHAAGDIFAHTYVNAYAGDIFELTDGEVEVERRHFVLEKYIESLTPDLRDGAGNPMPWTSGFGTATSFSRDALILNSAVASQYRKLSTGQHLAAMFDVRTAVDYADNLTQDIVGRITGWGADYFKKQLDLQLDLATGKTALDAAELILKGHEEALKLRRKAYEAALGGLDEARDLVNKYPEIINPQLALLDIQTNAVSNATVALAKASSDLAGKGGDIQKAIDGLVGKLGKLVCNIIGGVLPECDELNDKINELRGQLNVLKAAEAAAQEAVRHAERLRDETQAAINNLKDAHDRAVRGLADGTYEAAVSAAKVDLDLQEVATREARNAVAEAEKVVDRIRRELDVVGATIDEIKRAIDSYNLVTLFLRNWKADIGVASEEYIKSSHKVGTIMLLNSGNPVSEYWDWYRCYGQVFVAQPKEIGQAGCLVREGIERIKGEFDRAIDSLPELLRWVVAPSREAQKLVMKRLEPELKKAEFTLVEFLTNRSTADFLTLLSAPENATREKLVEVFSGDSSGKGLLVFNNVNDFVEKDLALIDGRIDPDRFAPLRHSVTLAKMTLLGHDQLNKLARNLSGIEGSPLYGNRIYPDVPGNFTLLFDMVRSIDGNHQWQAYGLPWPRRTGVASPSPKKLHYGHDYHQDHTKGFRFWVDPFLRERVFLALFPQGVLGALGERSELQWSAYKFPECPHNPFPATQDINGTLRTRDTTCVLAVDASRPSYDVAFSDRNTYRGRYFQCGQPIAEQPHWTVVGSFLTRNAASRHAEEINLRYPDQTVEVWEPRNSNRHWTVMAAACTSKARADEARDIAIRRGIARDAFVWSPRLPWKPYEAPADALASAR